MQTIPSTAPCCFTTSGRSSVSNFLVSQRKTHPARTARRQLPPPVRRAQPVPGLRISMDAGAEMTIVPQELDPFDVARAVQVPPLEYQLGAKVEHLTLQESGSLAATLSKALPVSQPLIKALMRFGAVYYCPVVPLPNERVAPTMSKEALASIAQAREQAIRVVGKNPCHQQPRRVLEDREVPAGGYARIHLHPKRFPAAHRVDWSSRVIHDAPEYVVVNKPAGTQVTPTVDNVLESVVACVEQVIGLAPDTLLPLHRLDAGTEGVLVLGKNPAFAKHFVKLLPEKGGVLKKMYRCLCQRAPPLGKLVHYVKLNHYTRGEPAHTLVLGVEGELTSSGKDASVTRADAQMNASIGADGDGCSSSSSVDGVRCELIVHKAEEVELTGLAAQDWGSTAWEVTIELITGRTHQIRAQMMAVGCPLLGDALYAGLLGAKRKADQISGEQEQEQPPGTTGEITENWSKKAQDEPLKPFALQAYRLEVHDPLQRLGPGPQVFEAGCPWWRA